MLTKTQHTTIDCPQSDDYLLRLTIKKHNNAARTASIVKMHLEVESRSFFDSVQSDLSFQHINKPVNHSFSGQERVRTRQTQII